MTNLKEFIPNETFWEAWLDKYWDLFLKHRFIALSGNLGAGKTFLIQLIAKKLEVTEEVTSPTFGIVNEYQSSEGEGIAHFDFYRAKNAEEILDLGWEYYLENNEWILVEWADKFLDIIPDYAVYLTLEVSSKGRNITINTK